MKTTNLLLSWLVLEYPTSSAHAFSHAADAVPTRKTQQRSPPIAGGRRYSHRAQDFLSPRRRTFNNVRQQRSPSKGSAAPALIGNRKSSSLVALRASPIVDIPPSAIVAAPSVPPSMQIAFVISAVLLIGGYHANLIYQERRTDSSGSGVKTWRQYQAETREDWSRHVRETEGWLYAVQTLRNAITAQTFLATTVLSLLTLITGKMWDILRGSAVGGLERRLLTAQLSSVALAMLLSSYNFLQGVRLMTHAGFMFPVAKGTKVDNIMRRSQTHQWLGLRWMYISLGPIAWAVGGSRAFFGMALVLLQFFRAIDRKPEGMKYEDFQGGGI